MSALLVYALFRVLWPTIGEPAETLMALLGLAAVLAWGRTLRCSVALWLLLAAIAVQVLSWTLGYFHHPDWVADNPQVDRLAKLFIFIAVAWWLGGSTRNTLLLWGLALVGYLLASFLQGGGIEEWRRGLEGERVGFGIRNLQHGSMLFGVMLLGVVVFSRRIMAPGSWRACRIGAWSLAASLCVIGVLIGQTRAVWLGLALSLPAVPVIWWGAQRCRRDTRPGSRGPLIAAAAALAIAVVAGLAFKAPLMERLGTESDVVAQLLDGNLEEVPYTSIGIRIHTWRAAMDWIMERPLVGWGGEGRGLVIDHTSWLPDFVKTHFGHLHNFFLEIWVAYGALGLAIFAALAFWIGRGTWLAWREGIMPGDIALFGAAFFVYWSAVNQFESYNSFWTGVYVHNIVVGGLVTHIWRWLRESGRCVFPHMYQRDE